MRIVEVCARCHDRLEVENPDGPDSLGFVLAGWRMQHLHDPSAVASATNDEEKAPLGFPKGAAAAPTVPSAVKND